MGSGREHGRTIPALLAVLLIAMAGPIAGAQTPPELSTDRPDLTESAALVPAGLWQFESGITRERIAEESGELKRFAVVELLTRVGISEVVEARLGTGYVHQRSSAVDGETVTRGVAGVMAGAKIRLSDGAALLAHLHIPVGHHDLRVPDLAPELVLAGEIPVSGSLELSGNFGGMWLSDEAAVFATAALGLSATERLGFFVEGFSAGAMHSRPIYQVETGSTYLLAPNLQVDCTGGATLFEADPGWFLGVGLSVRFPE
jgi:hypothetical protein